MKTISRILILLVAAFIVIGMTYAISQTTAAQALIGNQRGPNGNAGSALPAEFASGQGNLPSVVSGRPEGGPEAVGSQVTTLGRNLLIIGVIIFAVQLAMVDRAPAQTDHGIHRIEGSAGPESQHLIGKSDAANKHRSCRPYKSLILSR